MRPFRFKTASNRGISFLMGSRSPSCLSIKALWWQHLCSTTERRRGGREQRGRGHFFDWLISKYSSLRLFYWIVYNTYEQSMVKFDCCFRKTTPSSSLPTGSGWSIQRTEQYWRYLRGWQWKLSHTDTTLHVILDTHTPRNNYCQHLRSQSYPPTLPERAAK